MKKLILLLLFIPLVFSCQPNLKSKKQVIYESNSLLNNDRLIESESIELMTEARFGKHTESQPKLISTSFSFGRLLLNEFDSNGKFIDSISLRETYFFILKSHSHSYDNISEIKPSFINIKLDNDVVFPLYIFKAEKVEYPIGITTEFLFKLNNEQINILQKHNILSVKFNDSLEYDYFTYTALNGFNADGDGWKTQDFSQLLKGLILFAGNSNVFFSNLPKLPIIPYPYSNSQRFFLKDNYKKKIDSITNINP